MSATLPSFYEYLPIHVAYLEGKITYDELNRWWSVSGLGNVSIFDQWEAADRLRRMHQQVMLQNISSLRHADPGPDKAIVKVTPLKRSRWRRVCDWFAQHRLLRRGWPVARVRR